MKTPLSVSRRRFLSGLFSLGAAGLLPRENNAAAALQSTDHTLRVNALIRVLQEHHMRHDDVLREEQKANLVYAFEKIKPSNHVAEAVAVACSMSYQPVYHIVDEYVRRRRVGALHAPGHPVLMLKAWGVPDTYRMLIFREQIYALLAELTGRTLDNGRKVSNMIYRHAITESDFADLLCAKYRQILNSEEINELFETVGINAPTARPYAWCS